MWKPGQLAHIDVPVMRRPFYFSVYPALFYHLRPAIESEPPGNPVDLTDPVWIVMRRIVRGLVPPAVLSAKNDRDVLMDHFMKEHIGRVSLA
jgi:hypothetical protein